MMTGWPYRGESTSEVPFRDPPAQSDDGAGRLPGDLLAFRAHRGVQGIEKLLASLGDESEPSSARMARALWALLMSEEFAWVP